MLRYLQYSYIESCFQAVCLNAKFASYIPSILKLVALPCITAGIFHGSYDEQFW